MHDTVFISIYVFGIGYTYISVFVYGYVYSLELVSEVSSLSVTCGFDCFWSSFT
jgi:hypothetical protein